MKKKKCSDLFRINSNLIFRSFRAITKTTRKQKRANWLKCVEKPKWSFTVYVIILELTIVAFLYYDDKCLIREIIGGINCGIYKIWTNQFKTVTVIDCFNCFNNKNKPYSEESSTKNVKSAKQMFKEFISSNNHSTQRGRLNSINTLDFHALLHYWYDLIINKEIVTRIYFTDKP